MGGYTIENTYRCAYQGECELPKDRDGRCPGHKCSLRYSSYADYFYHVFQENQLTAILGLLKDSHHDYLLKLAMETANERV